MNGKLAFIPLAHLPVAIAKCTGLRKQSWSSYSILAHLSVMENMGWNFSQSALGSAVDTPVIVPVTLV